MFRTRMSYYKNVLIQRQLEINHFFFFFCKYLYSCNDVDYSFFIARENAKKKIQHYSTSPKIASYLFSRASLLYVRYEYTRAEFSVFPLQNHNAQAMRTLKSKCYFIIIVVIYSFQTTVHSIQL